MERCPKCGNKLSNVDVLCPRCGALVEVIQVKNSFVPPPEPEDPADRAIFFADRADECTHPPGLPAAAAIRLQAPDLRSTRSCCP